MTAPLIPGPSVPAPQPLRRRYGLFDAASGPLNLPAHGEGGGVRYTPDTCGPAYAYGITCYNGDNPAPEKPSEGPADQVATGVFAVLSAVECVPVGYTVAEYRALAQTRLEGAEQAVVENALWTGLDFEGNPLGILNLSEQAENIPAGYDTGLVTDVVGALERYAYTLQRYGYLATIHAPVEVAAFAFEAGLVLTDGPRKVTPLGTIWSFGAYPAGSMIITGQTTVWRAPSIGVYDAFDQVTNLALVVAERSYAVGFDCLAGRAEFDPLEVTSP